MDEKEIINITEELLDKHSAHQEAATTTARHRDFLSTGRAIDLNALSEVSTYKQAYEKSNSLEKEVEALIEKLIAAYPPELIWGAINLNQPIFLRRNRSGMIVLTPPNKESLDKAFKLGFIGEPK